VIEGAQGLHRRPGTRAPASLGIAPRAATYGQRMAADRAEHLRTAPEVADSLGIDARTLRAWLRETYKRADDDHGARWYLTRDMVDAAERQFGR